MSQENSTYIYPQLSLESLVIWGCDYTTVNDNNWEVASTSASFLNFYLETTTGSASQWVTYTTFLDAGTYDIGVVGVRGSARGIMNLVIDGNSAGSADWYVSSTTSNAYAPFSSFTVYEPKIVTITACAVAKNAASTDERIAITYIVIHRTAI